MRVRGREGVRGFGDRGQWGGRSSADGTGCVGKSRAAPVLGRTADTRQAMTTSLTQSPGLTSGTHLTFEGLESAVRPRRFAQVMGTMLSRQRLQHPAWEEVNWVLAAVPGESHLTACVGPHDWQLRLTSQIGHPEAPGGCPQRLWEWTVGLASSPSIYTDPGVLPEDAQLDVVRCCVWATLPPNQETASVLSALR